MWRRFRLLRLTLTMFDIEGFSWFLSRVTSESELWTWNLLLSSDEHQQVGDLNLWPDLSSCQTPTPCPPTHPPARSSASRLPPLVDCVIVQCLNMMMLMMMMILLWLETKLLSDQSVTLLAPDQGRDRSLMPVSPSLPPPFLRSLRSQMLKLSHLTRRPLDVKETSQSEAEMLDHRLSCYHAGCGLAPLMMGLCRTSADAVLGGRKPRWGGGGADLPLFFVSNAQRSELSWCQVSPPPSFTPSLPAALFSSVAGLLNPPPSNPPAASSKETSAPGEPDDQGKACFHFFTPHWWRKENVDAAKSVRSWKRWRREETVYIWFPESGREKENLPESTNVIFFGAKWKCTFTNQLQIYYSFLLFFPKNWSQRVNI